MDRRGAALLRAQAAVAQRTAQAADEVRPFHLWPEHLPAAQLFDAACTQWRHAGMDGTPTGLDYAGVRATACFNRLPAGQQEQAMDDLHWIELGWLAEQRRLQARRRQRPPGPAEPPEA